MGYMETRKNLVSRGQLFAATTETFPFTNYVAGSFTGEVPVDPVIENEDYDEERTIYKPELDKKDAKTGGDSEEEEEYENRTIEIC